MSVFDTVALTALVDLLDDESGALDGAHLGQDVLDVLAAGINGGLTSYLRRLISDIDGGVRVERVTLADTGVAAGDIAAWANPTGETILAEITVELTTASSGAGTIDAGVAANITTISDTLIDGQDVNAAVGVFNSGVGTNGVRVARLTSTQAITVSEKTGDTTGLAGVLHIRYWKLVEPPVKT